VSAGPSSYDELLDRVRELVTSLDRPPVVAICGHGGAPETAGERAKARNALQGDSREDLDLWDSRWVPEGQEYQRAVRPEQLAHLVMAAGGRD
jgi:hypothetical protein